MTTQAVRRVLIALLFLSSLVGATGRPAHAAGPRDSLVVSTAWLADHLKDPGLVILQTSTRATYDAGHIAGAQFVDVSVDFAAPRNPENKDQLSLELPDPAALRERLQKFGISDRSRVAVCYDDEYLSPSTRIILTLTWAGLGDKTVLVDGCMHAWKREGRPTTTEVRPVSPGSLAPLKTVPVTVDAAFVQANARKAGIAIVDVRGHAVYDGTRPNDRSGEPKLGHIPGALDLPLEELFNDQSMLRPAAELEAIFAKAGIKPSDTVVGYCFVGQRATAVLFAARTLGHKVLLYDGSMNDWTKRNLPLEVVKKDGQKPAQRDQLVVSPDWLAAHLKDRNLVVIHVGMGDADLYAAEHIPGAQYIKLGEFAAPPDGRKPGGLNLEMPSDADLAAMLAKHGISPASRVVLYFGKNQVSESTRVILTLDHAGLGANTSLLQGGLPAWKRGGHPTTTDVPDVTASPVVAFTPKTVTVDAVFVQNNVGRPGIALVDARDQAAYDGISGSTGRTAGHIPGAGSLYYRLLYNELNELRPAAELEAAFAKAGVKPGDTVIGYCWLGQFATAMLFAARSLGHDVLLYDGSFEDWSARKLPFETVKKGGGAQ